MKEKYYLFLDECGDQNIANFDPSFPIFTLCGIIVSEEQPQGYQIPQQAQVHQVPQQVVQNQGGQFQPNTYYNQYSAQQYGAEEEMPF